MTGVGRWRRAPSGHTAVADDGVAIDEQRIELVVESDQANRKAQDFPRHDLVLSIAGFAIEDRVGKVIAPLISTGDRKSTRLNSSHTVISYAVFCLKKKNTTTTS